MPEFVNYESRGDVAVLLVDNPPVNALSPGVPEAIGEAIARANAEAGVRAIVLAGAGRTFMAGADIREFTKPAYAPYVASLLNCARSVEDSAKPVVMAMHGTAFGAGLETALAGHYRVMSSSAQLGQPEVKLGLIPGAGGTQRLPRLVGAEVALEMCAFGEAVSASAALASGLVNALIEDDLVDGAARFARGVINQPIVKTRDLPVKNADPARFAAARERARACMPGQTAPLLAIDAIEATTFLPFEAGIKREAELFDDCWRGTQSRALIYLFFAERAASKVPEILDGDDPDDLALIDHPATRLMEIVCGSRASSDAIHAALDRAKKAGKVGIVVKEAVGERLWKRFQGEQARADNVLSALADEGDQLLKSGAARRESDIDLIWTLGYGFPAWRGGPMFIRRYLSGNVHRKIQNS